MVENIERVEIYPSEAEELCQSAQIERSIPQKTRDSYAAEDFAGPSQSFPITTQEQLDAAAHLIGHAADPEAVKRKAIAIAKRKGFTLPKAWQEDDKSEDRAVMPEMLAHPMLYAPIVRIDKEKREVEGVATSEAVDSFRTIFSYEASKRAFQKWIERTANVREMHERRAVGKGVGVFFDDANKQVIVRSRISRSADGENTWIKFQEGILNGYSVGATNPVWDTVERDGKKYPYLTNYDLSEISYVDNASNPDAQGLSLCRADGLTELVDITEPEAPPITVNILVDGKTIAESVVERAGARLSADSRTALHGMRDQAMSLCGCDECQGMQGSTEPDGDETDRISAAMIERVLPLLAERIERLFSPVYQRQQQFLARMAQTPEQQTTPTTIDTSALEDRLLTAIERVAASSSQSEVRAELSAVKATVERIAAQPLPGGPVLNGAQPVDKRLANQPNAYNQQPQREDTIALLQRLQASGALDTPDKQVAAAALAARPVQGRMG